MMFTISLYPSLICAAMASAVLSINHVYGTRTVLRCTAQMFCLLYIVSVYLSWVTTDSRLSLYFTVLIALAAFLIGLPQSLTKCIQMLGLGLLLAGCECVLYVDGFPAGATIHATVIICIVWVVAAAFGSSSDCGRVAIVSGTYLHLCILCNFLGFTSPGLMEWFCDQFWGAAAAVLFTKCLPIVGIRGFGSKPLI